MKKSIWMLGFFTVSLWGLILFPVHAQDKSLEMDQPKDWEEISGKIENLNRDTSMIIVKAYSDKGKTLYQEVPILITQEAKIVKAGQVFVLKDLQTGDEISVRYIVKPNGQRAAYYLLVK
jgi:hypothetical protein